MVEPIETARYERTVLVKLEPMAPRDPAFDDEILGRAEEVLPVLPGAKAGAAEGCSGPA